MHIIGRMGQHLATLSLSLSVALGGCSLIYNPNNLPEPQRDSDVPIDAPIDARMVIDANPEALALTKLTPTVLVEGTGDGGSRRAILVVHGTQIVDNNTTVTIAPLPPETRVPMIMVHNDNLEVSSEGNLLAVPLTVFVDTDLAQGEMIPLEVTVTQMTPSGMKSAKLDTLVLSGLNELDDPGDVVLDAADSGRYSRVNIAGDVTAAANLFEPIRIEATASIMITGSVDVSANLKQAGPGGGDGGDRGLGAPIGGSPTNGKMGGGPSPGLSNGAVGRWGGDDQLTQLGPSPNRGSGGAGGDGTGATLGGLDGGEGGGGGGALVLVGGGALSVGAIDASGGAGENVSNQTANDGGAGSGGVVLLRAGTMATVMAPGINVAGGATPTPGQAGRARVDAPMFTAAVVPTSPGVYRGPVFPPEPTTPAIVRDPRPTLMIIGRGSTTISYTVANDDGSKQVAGTVQIPPTGTFQGQLADPLYDGTNTVCLMVPGAMPDSDTRNCIEIAFLYEAPMM